MFKKKKWIKKLIEKKNMPIVVDSISFQLPITQLPITQSPIEKLEYAEVQIELLHKETNELQAKTLESSAELQALIDQSEWEARIVDEGRAVIEREKEKADRAAAEAQAVNDEVEAELSKAVPLLEEATAALDTLTSQDMSNLKQLANPDAKIRLVMEAVCIMKRVRPEKKLVETEIGAEIQNSSKILSLLLLLLFLEKKNYYYYY